MIKCPKCGDTGSIVGNEIRGVYDGVLYWVCVHCDFAWSRDWTGYGHRATVAQQHVDAYNNRDQ